MSTPYTVIDQDDNILKSGYCPAKNFDNQATNPNERVIEGRGCDIEDKVITDSDDKKKIVKRDKSDIDARREKLKPKEIPIEDQQANITNKQLNELLKRIEKLETK